MICLPRHQWRLGLPSSPPTQPSVSSCPPPPPPGSQQKVLAASSLSIGCLDSSLVSGLTCLKLGCGQMGDTCTPARRHTHTHRAGSGQGADTGSCARQVRVQPGGAADSPRSGGDRQEASPPGSFRGFGTPSYPPWFWTSQDRPSASPTHEAALIPALLLRDSGLDIWVPRAKGCMQTPGGQPSPDRGPSRCQAGAQEATPETTVPTPPHSSTGAPASSPSSLPSPPPFSLLPSSPPPPLLNYESNKTGKIELGKEKRENDFDFGCATKQPK